MTACSSCAANSVEAVNNKAWILHTYLGQTKNALEMVLALRQRVKRALLPSEFFDTLGTFRSPVGQTASAEKSYVEGLKKAPENPVLNFHLGKLIANDRGRA